MTELGASEALWSCVMKHFTSRNPKSAAFWRIASPTRAECSHCIVQGGQLIRCSHEKCKKEFHMDCGFSTGGFFLDENQELSFLCESHFKPILFCKCLKPYDVQNSAAMVGCEECLEWFHYSCVGLSQKQAASLSVYVCRSCTQLLEEGRHVSAQLKASNSLKEKKSNYHQDACKSLRILVEVAQTICPLIDVLNSCNGKRDTTKHICHEITPAEIADAADYLSAYPFVIKPSKSSEALEQVDFFGSLELICSWREQLLRFKFQYSVWTGKVKSYLTTVSKELVPSVSLEYIPTIEALLPNLQMLCTEGQSLIPRDRDSETDSSTSDRGPFGQVVEAFSRGMRWFIDLINILHSTPANEDGADLWFRRVDEHFRGLKELESRVQALAASGDSLAASLAQIFHSHADTASRLVSSYELWLDSATQIMEGSSSMGLPDLHRFIKQALEFPIKVPLVDQLQTLESTLNDLENRLQVDLMNSAMDSSKYESLQSEVNDCLIRVPSARLLDFVGERLNFLANYDSIVDQARVSVDVLEQLRFICAELDVSSCGEQSSEQLSLSSPASRGLDIRVAAARDALNSLVDSSSRLASTARCVLLSGEVGADVLLSLKQQRVITAEELLLEYAQTGEDLVSEVEGVINKPQSLNVDDAGRLIASMEEKLEIEIPDEFIHLTQLRLKLDSLYRVLVDSEANSRHLWENVSHAIDRCTNGRGVEMTKFTDLIDDAQQSLVTDSDVLNAANSLITKAVEVTAVCNSKLPQIFKTVQIDEINSLVSLALTVPMQETLMDSLLHRQTVLQAVAKCQELFTTDLSTLTDSIVSDLRKQRSLIDHLIAGHSSREETDLIQSIYAEFQLFCWELEVQFVLVNKSTELKDAQSLLLLADKNETSKSSTQCHSLRQAVLEGEEMHREALRLLQVIDGAREVTASHVVTPLSPSSQLHQLSSAIAPFLELYTVWSAAVSDVERSLHTLLDQLSTSVLKQSGCTKSLREALELVNELTGTSAKIGYIDSVLATPQNISQASFCFEFRDVTVFANNASLLSHKYPHHPLIKHATSVWVDIHAKATSWNESAQSLLPAKATRRQVRPDAKTTTVDHLRSALEQPIVRVVNLPMAERVLEVLTSVTSVCSSLSEFLSPSRPKDAAIDFQSEIFNDLVYIGELQVKSEVIPVEFPESKVFQWLVDVLMWMQGVPPPEANPRMFAMSMDTARERLRQGSKLLHRTPDFVQEVLFEYNVAQVDAGSGFLSFNDNANNVLKNSTSYLQFLEVSINRSEEFQFEIRNAIASARSVKVLQDLLSSLDSLLVSPEVDIKKALENSISRWKAQEPAKEKPVDQKKRSRGDEARPSTPASTRRQQKRGKFSFIRCAAQQCSQEAASDSCYCSKACSQQSVGELFTALLAYRTQLCVGSHSLKVPDDEELVASFESDLSVFHVEKIQLKPAMSRLSASLHRGGLIVAPPAKVSAGPTVSALLMPLDDQSADATSNSKSYLSCLPAAAASVFGVDESSGSSSPRASGKPSISTHVGVDGELRQNVRVLFEDIFSLSLQRSNVPGAICMGAVLAMELEIEMHQKYSPPVVSGSVKPEFNKKDYRRHQIMLVRNLKQQHNDQLILRLAHSELSMDALLGMSVQQLADAATQSLRAKEISTAVLDSQLKQSAQEELEARCQETMGGNEFWRDDGGLQVKDPSSQSRRPVSSPSSLSVDSQDEGDAANEDRVDSPSSPAMRSPSALGRDDVVDAEELVSATKPQKRSISPDAGTRFTTNRTRPKREESVIEEPIVTSKVVGADDEFETQKSPRTKAPNVLELLKANIRPPETTPVTPSPSAGPTAVRLVNSTGGLTFTVVRPGAPAIECVGVVLDRRIQGLVKGSISIDGRTKIAELERFLKEVISFGRKLVVTFRMYCSHRLSGPDSPYRKLCDEYSRDLRAGISNVTEHIQAYLVPPELKGHLSIFKDEVAGVDESRSFYGIVVSRSPGPVEFVRMEPPRWDMSRPPSPGPAITTAPVAPIPTMAAARPAAPAAYSHSHSQSAAFDMEAVKKVAQFCALNGVQAIQVFKEKPNAMTTMPFLFEGQPGNVEFTSTLKQILLANSTQLASAAAPTRPAPFPLPRR